MIRARALSGRRASISRETSSRSVSSPMGHGSLDPAAVSLFTASTTLHLFVFIVRERRFPYPPISSVLYALATSALSNTESSRIAPLRIRKKRTVSAPNLSAAKTGDTPLPADFEIFFPLMVQCA